MEAIGQVISQFFTKSASQFVESEGRALRGAVIRVAYALALVVGVVIFTTLGIALVLFAVFVRLEASVGISSAALATAAAAFFVSGGLMLGARELTRTRAR